jgi:hypothetical protein
MLGKIWLTSMTAATLLTSPAFAGWPSGQRAQIDAAEGRAIIREVVVNGGLIGAESDEPPPNELRPVPIGSTTAALSIAGPNTYGE